MFFWVFRDFHLRLLFLFLRLLLFHHRRSFGCIVQLLVVVVFVVIVFVACVLVVVVVLIFAFGNDEAVLPVPFLRSREVIEFAVFLLIFVVVVVSKVPP